MIETSNERAHRRASEVLFDEVLASRNSLRRNNIEALKAVCDRMEKDRVQISAAEVVRRCEASGPKYSTVSNKGSALGEYIRLRILEQSADSKPSASLDKNLADFIQDPVLQARVRDVESQARWMQRENVALRAILKTLKPGVDIDSALAAGPINGGDLDLFSVKPSPTRTTDPENAAVVIKIITHLVAERQYKFYRGRLCINGKSVLSPDDVTRLQSVTGLSDAEWKDSFYSSDDGSGIGR